MGNIKSFLKNNWKRGIIISSAVLIVVLFANYFYISNFASLKKCSSNGRYVGIVMGTSPYTRRGYKNPFFTERLEMAVRLYNKGVLQKLVISGVSEPYYDEVGWMRETIINSGVPDSLIIIDTQGTRTWQSVLFVLNNYPNDSIAFISQNFHSERAVYLASQTGLNACYFPMSNRITPVLLLRELLSRLRVHIDLALWKLRSKRNSE
ncbi:MAG: hypothetical protein GXO48_00310 [Chlorobi bacterium]|nr:hypothetical protein [Chlorobiota bacterium]